MEFRQTDLPGVVHVIPDVHRDERGFFLEVFHRDKYREGGIDASFVQDNHSRSVKGTLRGLHLQRGEHAQGKLIRVLGGAIYDVAVDIRVGSPTFGRWIAVELSDENFEQLYVPPDYAHGFLVLSEVAEVEYKCTALYDKASELGILWNDPMIGIPWPDPEPLLSEKDIDAPRLAEVMEHLPQYRR